MRKLLVASIRFAALVASLVFFGSMLIACGREPSAPKERICALHMVIADTIWIEPGHKVGGFVLEPQCK